MHANGLEIQFAREHYNRITKAAEILKMELPDFFTFDFFKKQVSGLLSRCKLFQAVRVKLTVYRTGEGLFITGSKNCDIIIEASYLDKGYYKLNEKGLTLGIFTEIPKPDIIYNTIKSINAQIYILAGIYARKKGFDDVLLINNKGCIVEATSSNVFCVKNNNIYTPALSSGCVEGIMRKQIIDIAGNNGFNVVETEKLLPGNLLEADEIFLTNAISGIRYVLAYKNKRYFKHTAQKFINELNKTAFKDYGTR
jgi:branched-chain amino acid aminotransferase